MSEALITPEWFLHFNFSYRLNFLLCRWERLRSLFVCDPVSRAFRLVRFLEFSLAPPSDTSTNSTSPIRQNQTHNSDHRETTPVKNISGTTNFICNVSTLDFILEEHCFEVFFLRTPLTNYDFLIMSLSPYWLSLIILKAILRAKLLNWG